MDDEAALAAETGRWVDELLQQSGPGGRILLGVVGPPAAGKTRVAGWLAAETQRRLGPGSAVVVGMDGFHLANEVLIALGRRDRKGAPDTFDVDGLVALLGRLRRRDEPVIYAPRFDRRQEEAIAGAVPVARDARLIVVEGNYLLLDDPSWRRIGGLLDAAWYIDVPAATCRARLIERQRLTYGTLEAAEDWVRRVDEPNAAIVAATRRRADRVVAPGDLGPS